jgi:Oxidoreductase molybdopterin binding domain
MSWSHEWDLKDEGVYHSKRTDELLWQQAKQRGMSRRRLLQVIAAGRVSTTLSGVRLGYPQGTPWQLVAIGVAEWTGVPLSAVLDRAGLKRITRDVMAEGLDDLRVGSAA